ncbi:hypothetical protein [Paraburkholderia flava]|nr:hypothetical protein [Paraburkholderia flava]
MRSAHLCSKGKGARARKKIQDAQTRTLRVKRSEADKAERHDGRAGKTGD